jgi:hypothetical protein
MHAMEDGREKYKNRNRNMQQLKFAGGHPPNYYAADTELK